MGASLNERRDTHPCHPFETLGVHRAGAVGKEAASAFGADVVCLKAIRIIAINMMLSYNNRIPEK